MKNLLIGLVIIILIASAGFFAGRKTAPIPVATTDTIKVIQPVNLDSVITKARFGYIRYDYAEFIKQFGSVYRDTVYFDSLHIDTQFVSIPVLTSRDTLEFTYSDTLIELSGSVDIQTTAFMPPLALIKNKVSLYDLNIIVRGNAVPIVSPREFPWWDRFKYGAATTVAVISIIKLLVM